MKQSSVAIMLAIFVLTGIPARAIQKNFNLEAKKVAFLDGARVITLIPPGLGVKMTPQRIEPSDNTSVLHYTFALTGNDTVYGLRWAVYVGDQSGRLINKEFWWDRGEWPQNSPVEESTEFKYRKTYGSTIVVVLREVISDDGVRSVSDDEAEQEAVEVVAGRAARPLRTKFVAHASISEENTWELIRRSLSTVQTSNDLKGNLLIREGEQIFFLQDGLGNSINLPGVTPISAEQIKDKLKSGESIMYFEFCCVEVHGKSVVVTLNYHMPRVSGQILVRKGITLEFTYYKEQNDFLSKVVKTYHF